MMNFNKLRGVFRKLPKADKSAVGAMNRPLHFCIVFRSKERRANEISGVGATQVCVDEFNTW
jgi:hypothetical protein